MEILAYTVFAFALIQFVTALSNWVFGQPLPKENPKTTPRISVLIPARNEEENLPKLLTDLLNQTYMPLEILVYNDFSSDNTERIIDRFAQKNNRIKSPKPQELPPEWLGKNHACHRLAQAAKGDYYLFLDADVRLQPDLMAKTTAYAEKHQTALLSIFPTQYILTLGERLTVPLMHYILLSLLPLILVRKSPFAAHAAANGQFMLFDARIYRQYHPHQRLKSEKVEDIAISRFLKTQNQTVACLTGSRSVCCRMYTSFSEAVEGFSKNIVMFFGGSAIAAVLFWLATTLGFIPVLMVSKKLFFVYIILVFFTKILTSIVARQKVMNNLLLFIPQQLVMGYIILQSFRKKKTWKGRSI